MTWDCVGGVLLTVTDQNGNTVTNNSYTANGADPFYRVKTVADALNNVLTYTYSPASLESSLSTGTTVLFDNVTSLDGLGRPLEGQIKDGTNYDTVSNSYSWGASGQTVATSAVPCAVPLGTLCPPSPVVTANFDGLHRVSSVVNSGGGSDGGGGSFNHTYSANDDLEVLGPAPSGENTKQLQTEYDGLGRIKSVCQILSSGGSSCGQSTAASGILTTVTYSMFTGGVQVKSTRGQQSRTTLYDGLGRVTSVTAPEEGTTQYVYDTASSTCYNIVSKGDLVETIDNAQVHTCYGYDPLHRVTGYGAVGSGTACPNFVYGDQSYTPPSGVTITNGKGRFVEAYTSATCNSARTTDEWFSYDADGNLTDMWELTPHSGGYYHTSLILFGNGLPSSLSGIPGYMPITYSLDGAGRPFAASEGSTNIVSGVTYNAASQPLTISIGNSGGDTSGYAYYPNTGRTKSYTFGVGSSQQSQSGTLKWNNNGTVEQLAINDGFNTGGTQTCNYLYDDLGRLGTPPGSSANSVDCGSLWQQTFTYDQYDNVTKTGSQSWACAACYDATTNHYNSTLSPSISYDLDGHLLNDTFNTYSWDAFGHLATVGTSAVCGTSGACLTYDAFGRMVEKSVNSTYTEILYSPLGKTATMSGQATTNSYLPLPGGGTLFSSGSAGTNRFYQHKDWLGTVRLVGCRKVTITSC